MKLIKYRKLNITIIVFLFFSTIIVSAEYRTNNTKNFDLYDYEIVWSREWSDGYLSGGTRNAVNSLNDIVVCGVRNTESGIIIEWNETGDFLWKKNVKKYTVEIDNLSIGNIENNKEYKFNITDDIEKNIQQILEKKNSEIFPLMDVVVDSENRIISVGTLFENNHTKQTIGLVKYDSDGYQIWNKTYEILPIKNSSTMSTGLTVDSNDNIYISGNLIIENPPFYTFLGLIIKLLPDGEPVWIRTSNFFKKTVYIDVDVDSDDNVITTGFLLNLISKETNTIVSKYDKNNGRKINEAFIDFENNSMPISIKIDRQDDSVYIVGGTGPSLTGFITKLDKDLNVLWNTWGYEGNSLFTDIALMNNGRDIVLSGCFGINNYSAAIFDKDTGKNKLIMDLGSRIGGGFWGLDDYMKGVSVDNNGDIIVTGARGAIKIIKIRIIEAEEKTRKNIYDLSTNFEIDKKHYFLKMFNKNKFIDIAI